MLRLQGYRVDGKISEDESICCYKGVRVDDQMPILVKCLKSNFPDPLQKAQFRKEFDNTARLSGVSGVVQAIELLSYGHSLVIVYEHFISEPLIEWSVAGINLKKYNILDVIALVIQAVEILLQVHQNNVIHKDISPLNLLYLPNIHRIKITGFGASSLLSQEHHGFQNPNQFSGSMAYISPEQTGRLNRALDYRSDLYSLGATLYHLLTGRAPFEGMTGVELIYGHIALTPVAPNALRNDIPCVLSNIVMRLLEKMPDDRYQSAEGLKYDLECCLANLKKTEVAEPFTLAAQDRSPYFKLPQKLYGRSTEIQNILNAFQCSMSRSALLLVAGSAGTGKTTLVQELYRPITERRGYFVTGKFEQYQQDIPFYGWCRALEEYVNYLLKEDEEVLSEWRRDIQLAVGNIGAVVTDLIPSLGLLIGDQPEVPELSDEKSRNRLNYLLSELIKSVCRSECPLVIFLDDWQWADLPSMNLLEYLLKDGGGKYLLIIAAYRDNEVSDKHPFSLTLGHINTFMESTTIQLSNLTPVDVYEFLVDTLHDENVDALAKIVYEKTKGNAFFLAQFVRRLYHLSLLKFDLSKRCWQWDVSEVCGLSVTENVIEILESKLLCLPAKTLECLKIAACMGSHFNLKTLAILCDNPTQIIIENLECAIHAEIIVPLDIDYRFGLNHESQEDMTFRFEHDRVQQASYELNEIHAKDKLHFHIANIMLSNRSNQDIQLSIFDVVKHFILGKSQITSMIDKRRYISLCADAGSQAKTRTAYTLALSFYREAIEFLPDDHWKDDKGRSVDIFLDAINAAYLSANYEKMETWANSVLEHITTSSQEIQLAQVRLRAYTAQNRLGEAVNQALRALRLTGIKFNASPSKRDIALNVIKTQWLLRGRSFKELLAIPPMTDTVRLKTMDILGMAIPPVYWTSPNLLFLMVFQITRDSIKYGYSPMTGFGYSWWGITECVMLGNIDRGYEYGEFGIKLSRRHGLGVHQSLFYFGWIIKPFKQHISASLIELRETFQCSLGNGDFEYASYALNNIMQVRFHCGDELTELLNEMSSAHDNLTQYQLESSVYWNAIWWQTSLNFVKAYDSPCLLIGEGYDETKLLKIHKKVNDVSTLFFMYCAKLMLSVFFGDWRQAEINEVQAKSYLRGGVGTFAYVLYHFYSSLSLIVQAQSTSGLARKKLLLKVAANQRKMKNWAKHAAMNHLHRWYLVEAELQRLRKREMVAAKYYDLAIDHANRHHFIQDEALAFEFAGLFYKGWDKNKQAEYYFAQAHHLYLQWGAHAKVNYLRRRHPRLNSGNGVTESADSLGHPEDFNGQSFLRSVDMASIINASQAISCEIVFDELIKTLLRIMIENAGARKGVLLFQRGRNFLETVSAAEVINNKLCFFNEEVLSQGKIYPRSIINFVARKEEVVLLDDAGREGKYAADQYVVDNHCQSIVCQPISYQGKLVAIIYLENNLMSAVFNSNRLKIITLLSSQAAISLINANHYTLLENEVSLRTGELQEKNRALELATETKSGFLAKMSHEIRTPINAMIGLNYLVLQTRTTNEQRYYLQDMLSASQGLLRIIDDILDFSKVEAGKLDLEISSFCLDALLEGAVAVCMVEAQKKKLEIITCVADDTPRQLTGDSLRIQQILVNLIGNAVKFTEEGAIYVRVSMMSDNMDCSLLAFSIEDSGIGITKDQRENLFVAFSQCDETITRNYGGSGLGLAICKQLTEIMGGEIWLESDVNSGSIFHFTVKVCEQDTNTEIKSESSHQYVDASIEAKLSDINLHGARLLVVEDNLLNLKVTIGLLHRANVNVDVAVNGRIAVEKVIDNEYDLVLMDIQMPVMDGFTAAREIRKLADRKKLPILAMTAHAMNEDREKSIQAGMNDHISKPVEAEEFYRKLYFWLGFEQSNTQLSVHKVPELALQQYQQDQKSQQINALRKCPSIRVNDAVKNIQGNTTLYLSLVNGFVRQCDRAYDEIGVMIKDLNRIGLIRYFHSFKSNAYYIGASELSGLASDLEKWMEAEVFSIETGPSNVESEVIEAVQLSGFFNSVETVLEELQEALTIAYTFDHWIPELFEIVRTLDMISQVSSLIVGRDAEVEGKMLELCALCQNTIFSDDVCLITDLLNNVEYEQAGENLKILEKKLKKSDVVEFEDL